MSRPVVVVDANVLYGIEVTDLLLTLATSESDGLRSRVHTRNVQSRLDGLERSSATATSATLL